MCKEIVVGSSQRLYLLKTIPVVLCCHMSVWIIVIFSLIKSGISRLSRQQSRTFDCEADRYGESFFLAKITALQQFFSVKDLYFLCFCDAL